VHKLNITVPVDWISGHLHRIHLRLSLLQHLMELNAEM